MNIDNLWGERIVVETLTRATTNEAEQSRLKERVAAVETILVVVPLVLTEVLLLVSMFMPFVSTEISEREETVNLWGLVFGLFGSTSDGEPDGVGIAFGVAFLVLLLVVIGSLVTIPLIGRRRLTSAAAGTATVFAALLALGTAGAWLVMAMGMNANDTPWVIEPALPLLTVAALLAALLVFLPAYRGIWTD